MCAGSGNQTNFYRQISIDGTAAMIVGKELTCQSICLLNKRYYEINFLSMTVASLKTELRFLTKPTKVKQNKKCPTSTLSISDSDLSGTIFSRKVLLQLYFLTVIYQESKFSRCVLCPKGDKKRSIKLFVVYLREQIFLFPKASPYL